MPSKTDDRFVEDLIRREQRKADVRPAVIVGPSGQRDTWEVRMPGKDSTTVARGAPGVSYAPGSMVPTGSQLGGPGRVILQQPAAEHAGAWAYAPETGPLADAPGASLALFSLSPSAYEVGSTSVPASAFGVSIPPLVTLRPVTIAASGQIWDLPGVSFGEVSRVSDTQVDLTVTVDETVPEGQQIDLLLIKSYAPDTPLATLAPAALVVDAPPVVPPQWLHVWWPEVGPLRAWMTTAEGLREDLPAVSASHSLTAADPGKIFARSMAVHDAYPDSMPLAWVEGTQIYLVDLLAGGAPEAVPLTYSSQGLPTFRASSGLLHWIEYGGGSTHVMRRESDGTVSQIGSAVGTVAAIWHRDSVALGGGPAGILLMDLDSGSTSVAPLFGSSPGAATSHSMPEASEDSPYLECSVGGLGYSGGWRLTRSYRAPNGNYLRGADLSFGDAEVGIAPSFSDYAHFRASTTGTAGVLFPYDAAGAGRWFDPGENRDHPRNSDGGADVGFDLFDDQDPTSYPHAVWPLSVDPPWSDE